MDISVVGTFIRGYYNEIKISKTKGVLGKIPFFFVRSILYSLFYLS